MAYQPVTSFVKSVRIIVSKKLIELEFENGASLRVPPAILGLGRYGSHRLADVEIVDGNRLHWSELAVDWSIDNLLYSTFGLFPESFIPDIETYSPPTDFLAKWSGFKSDPIDELQEGPVSRFISRVARQQELLRLYERDPLGFDQWGSAWFKMRRGKLRVQLGRSPIEFAPEIRFVTLDSVAQVREFFDDVSHRARTSETFQAEIEADSKRIADQHRAAAD